MFSRGQVFFIVAVWVVVLLMFPQVRDVVMGPVVREWNALHEAQCPEGYIWAPPTSTRDINTVCFRPAKKGDSHVHRDYPGGPAIILASPVPPVLQ